MAGIYIHIPYCKQACHYCDFHFSTQQQTRENFLIALLKEIELQKNYLQGEKVETIYFGGGTPSLLGETELNHIFEKLFHTFPVSASAEITLEANPDDLTKEKVSMLRKASVNRLSIGAQSFFDKDLQWMNRAHNSQEADASVKRVQDSGIDNISIDLIYGLPDSTVEEWGENLRQAFQLSVKHLSCYSLTVEPKTALAHFIKSGKSKPVDENLSAAQFEILMNEMKSNGWLHYEISNFCLENFYSKHNTSYWQGKKYLGLGPSAHSFNGHSRQWNISNNNKYIESIDEGKIPFEKEILTEIQRINERIMTELRTMWGLNIVNFESQISDSLRSKSEKFVTENFLELKDNSLMLTNKGKLIADKIILELMLDEV